MTLITYKPTRSVYNDVDKLMDNFWNFNYTNYESQNIDSIFNIINNKDGYIVTADLPGVDKKNIDISLLYDVLTITGERKKSVPNEEYSSIYSNTKYGKFEKSLYLPEDIDRNQIKASMRNGVLRINIQKSKKIRSDVKKIVIK